MKRYFIIVMVCLMSLAFIPVQAETHQQGNLPRIISIITDIPIQNNWVTLPKGAGKLTIKANITKAEKVRFWIVPTGTQTWNLRKLISEDTYGKDGWSATFTYGDEDILAHIVVEAIGQGGISRESINVYHEKLR